MNAGRGAAVLLLLLSSSSVIVSAAADAPAVLPAADRGADSTQRRLRSGGAGIALGSSKEALAEVGVGSGGMSGGLALALGGGGFRAFATDVGLFAGLAAAGGRSARAGESSEGQALSVNLTSRLFRQAKLISTVSGSSWFLAQLAYSGRFADLLERMAASPSAAGASFGESWMDKWLAVGRAADSRMEASALHEVLEDAGFSFLEQDVQEIAYFWKRGLSWNDFVATLLEKTAGLGSDTRLGSPIVSPSLANKTWLVCHSAVMGQRDKEALLGSGLAQSVHYHITESHAGPELPLYLPAKYSVVLGSPDVVSIVSASADASASTAASDALRAPLPYFAEQGSDLAIEYKGTVFFGIIGLSARSPSLGELRLRAAERMAALPVVGAVSASSAFAGGVCVNSPLATAAGLLNSDFTPWSSLAQGSSEAFRTGVEVARDVSSSSVSRKKLREAAEAGVVGVIDGAYTDNSGVGHAVAAGASEVVMVVNDLEALYGLFQNDVTASEQVGVPRLHLPIFSQHLTSAMMNQNKTEFALSPGNRFIEEFLTMSFEATTVYSEPFGIEAGRRVALHVVFVKTKLQIGGLDDYLGYNTFVQNVVDCVTSETSAHLLEKSPLRYLL